MDAPVIDRTKLDAFVMRAVGDLSAGYGGVMVSLGAKLGLYKAMASAGPLSANELAARAGCAARYVREWLNAQAAGGYVDYHAVSDTYELTPEQALVLADEDSPLYIPHAWNTPASMWFDEHKALEAFRNAAATWEVAGGTGAFAGAHGSGTSTLRGSGAVLRASFSGTI